MLQEIRKMRFESCMLVGRKGRLSQEEARVLGVCSRTFRRQICRYEEDGMEGLNDRRLTQASHREAPVDEVMKLTERYPEELSGLEREALLFLVYPGMAGSGVIRG